MGKRTFATLSNVSGSCFLTQSNFGAVKPAMAMLPAISRDLGSRASISTHSAKDRASFHRIAGRKTLSDLSISVAPCCWPESPMPSTAATAFGFAFFRSATTFCVAFHQSAGACSDHPSCNRDTFRGDVADATIFCLSSISTPLTEEVPISSPRYMCLLSKEDCRARRCRCGCVPWLRRAVPCQPWPSAREWRCVPHGPRSG